jgi:3-dehydroquinate synthetase
MMVKKHYRELNLQSDIKKYFKKKDINKIIKYMKSDKKNFNENINLVLLKKIGSKPTLIDFSKNKLKVFLADKFS